MAILIIVIVALPLFIGLIHDDLKVFLMNNVPKSKKKKSKYILGVADTKLGAAIQETLEISCTSGKMLSAP